MRIAQIAPLTEAVPPTLYGGTERVISWLTEELVALGHDVTLFASGDSMTSAKLEPMWPRALRLDGTVRDPNALHMMMIEQVYRRAHEFDLMHFHLDYYPFSLMSRQPTPFVTTLHGRLDLPEHQPIFATFSIGSRRLDLEFAAPADPEGQLDRRPCLTACRRDAAAAAAGPAALSRLPRTHLAGESASIAPSASRERCGMPLKIAAKVDRADEDYFDEDDQAAAVDAWRRVHRRDRRRAEVRIPERRHRLARADRLARAVRARHDRGHGLRRAGGGLQPRLGLRNRRRRRDGLHRGGRDERRGRRARGRRRCPAARSVGGSKSGSPPAAWPKTISVSIAALIDGQARATPPCGRLGIVSASAHPARLRLRHRQRQRRATPTAASAASMLKAA